jgi:recombination DNA repair RAD52 pathway protein
MFDSFDFLSMVFTALCIGFGSAIGNYLATKTLIRNIDKIIKKVNNK